MKKILYIIIPLILLSSCGPKRMGCGARGICKTSQDLKSAGIKKNPTVFLNSNQKPIRLR